MCKGRVQDVRDGIISRSIWAIGKLKRLQSNRDGGANVFFYKSLKNLHDYWCEGNWTMVIQARGFTVLKHRDYFLKEVGTKEVAITEDMTNWYRRIPMVGVKLWGLRQAGQKLERCVEDFLKLVNQLSWPDTSLGACFQLGLDSETIQCELPVYDFPPI